LVGVTFGGKVTVSNYTPPATAENPKPGPSTEVDVFTCKVERKELKTYAYTIPVELAEGDKPPF
jgi:hypothetical protein